jgi:hypothetical protein
LRRDISRSTSITHLENWEGREREREHPLPPFHQSQGHINKERKPCELKKEKEESNLTP